MKKIIIFLVITLILGTVGYAIADITIENAKTAKTDELLAVALNEKSHRAVDLDSINKTTDINSVKTLLESKGYYYDDVVISLRKYIEAAVMYEMTEAEFDYIMHLVNAGYDFEKLMDIYSFSNIAYEDISCLKTIYDIASPGFTGEFWMENAYDDYLGEKSNPLSLEDVYHYAEQGFTVDEMLKCHEMSMYGTKDIHEILDEKLDGKEWYDIAAEVYSLPTLQLEELPLLDEILTYAIVARKAGYDLKDAINTDAGFAFKDSVIESYNKKNLKASELIEKYDLIDDDGSKLIEAVKNELSQLDDDVLLTLFKENYRIRDIKEAVKPGTNTPVAEKIRSIVDSKQKEVE